MALIQIDWKPKDRDLRLFGGVYLPLFCLVVAGLVWWKAGPRAIPAALAGAALLAAPLAWLRPGAMRPLCLALMCLAFPIGWTVSHLLLGAIWTLVVTPIGLLSRLVGRDPLGLRFDRAAASYWVKHSPPAGVERYFRQF